MSVYRRPAPMPPPEPAPKKYRRDGHYMRPIRTHQCNTPDWWDRICAWVEGGDIWVCPECKSYWRWRVEHVGNCGSGWDKLTTAECEVIE